MGKLEQPVNLICMSLGYGRNRAPGGKRKHANSILKGPSWPAALNPEPSCCAYHCIKRCCAWLLSLIPNLKASDAILLYTVTIVQDLFSQYLRTWGFVSRTVSQPAQKASLVNLDIFSPQTLTMVLFSLMMWQTFDFVITDLLVMSMVLILSTDNRNLKQEQVTAHKYLLNALRTQCKYTDLLRNNGATRWLSG